VTPEPFGRVIIEAMLCQRPVVATAAGGAIELVQPGETGWLTCPGQAAELQQVICQVQASPQTTEQIVGNAYQYAMEHFQLSQTQQQTDDLLNQMMLATHPAKTCLCQTLVRYETRI
jgi:glycosyltransferase involved in cell wall biosynthesis